MSQPEKGKNIFQQAINAVSNRDEKEALEAAAKQAAALEQEAAESKKKLAVSEQLAAQTAKKLADAETQITQLTADVTKAKSDLDAARKDLVATRTTLNVTQQKLAITNAELTKYVSAEQAERIAAAAKAAEEAKIIAEHTLKADETLSHLSLKYYGSAYEPYWRVIYEANKELIGDNPGRVRPGMVIKIPVLPEELKKK